MKSVPPALPGSPGVPLGALARLFDATTNSYKFLFFHALLDHIRSRPDQALTIPFEEIAARMLSLAWYPAAFSRLSFGRQDQITGVIEDLFAVDEFKGYSFEAANYEDPDDRLRAVLSGRPKIVSDLLRYVPYRLLAPIFEQELRGAKDNDKNTRICDLAQQHFGSGRVPYRFQQSPTGAEIILDRDWFAYFLEHGPVLEGWVRWHWCQYMLRRNPSTPNVAGRLFKPSTRESIDDQKHFWRQVGEHMKIRCIYTDEPMSDIGLSLDHFLPWAFVGHDELWNLAPVPKALNSAKGKRLPAENFVPKLADLHAEALIALRPHVDQRQWEKRVEPYRAGLSADLPTRDGYGLTDKALGQRIREGYRRTVCPLLQLAAGQGFAPDWSPQRT
jgi:hypothetical protein